MKRISIILIWGIASFARINAAEPVEFAAALRQYEDAVGALIAGEQNDAVKGYLTERLTDARALNGLEPGDQHLSGALAQLVEKRLAATGSLDAAIRRSDSSRKEDRAYAANLGKYISDEYMQLLSLQEELLLRKYFKTETAKNANFLEGIVNSYWKLTRAEQGDPKKILLEDSTLGIKPWEAIFRLEPTMVMRSGPQAAIIGTAGLSYTFFPMVDRSSPPAITLKESFQSKVVKKSGLRGGAGAARLDGKTRFVIGGGVQLNALGVWCLYEPKHRIYMLGLSTADLSKLQKLFGVFN